MSNILKSTKLDIALVKPYFKTICFTLLLPIVFAAINRSLLTGVSFAMCFIAMTTGYTFSITEKNSMDRLFGILPVRKSELVIGRYVFVLAMGLLSLIISLIAQPLVLKVLGETVGVFDIVTAAIAGVFLFALYTVFQIPGYYKYGSIKGRVFMYIPVAGFLVTLLLLNMSGMDGLTVCQKIREHIACPILFLTARIESSDKIIGFQAGADDYIVKPFDLDELGARIAAHLRREQRRQNNSAVRFFGELILDYSARTVTINNQNIPLSKREFEIVELLSLNAGQVFDRERIYERVWGLDGDGNSDTIMEHIRKIRAKFAAHTLHNYIETVWGCGYRWNA